jgi:hypothetical protein
MAETYSMRLVTAEQWWKQTGQHYEELKHALVSRPLTIDELTEVGRLGHRLLVVPMQSYNQSELQAEYLGLLAIQQLIQLAAAKL